jgi:hypothetical protein
MGNLKNLQYQLNQALKIHGNTKYKVARNSSVWDMNNNNKMNKSIYKSISI